MSGSAKPSDLHVPVHPVRFVTAAALFDGHDAAINIMRPRPKPKEKNNPPKTSKQG